MPDFSSSEEEAARYVLNEMNADERREFEVRLAQSADLRTLVSELEEGSVALTMASPQRRPPSHVWTRIEKAVTRSSRTELQIPTLWKRFWWSGWAAATACIIGWLLYAVWVNRPSSSNSLSEQTVSGINSQPGTSIADVPREKTGNIASQDRASSNPVLEMLQARAQEVGALRWQIAELTNQMTQFSQVLTNQQALLSESSRLKFFQLTPAFAGSNAAVSTQVSPELQRALLVAMARQLGWNTSAPPAAATGAPTESPRVNQAGVDFVDLRPASNNAPDSVNIPQVEPQPDKTLETASLVSSPSNAIPGFIAGTNAVLAFDSSVVAPGSSVTFLNSLSSTGASHALGTAVLGINPLVVTIPLVHSSYNGGNITVIGSSAFGGSNVLGQFSIQTPLSP